MPPVYQSGWRPIAPSGVRAVDRDIGYDPAAPAGHELEGESGASFADATRHSMGVSLDPYRDLVGSKNVVELRDDHGAVVGHTQAALAARGSSRIRRLWLAFRIRFLGYHSGLTDLECRLPNGQIGKVEAVYENGEWILVCRMP